MKEQTFKLKQASAILEAAPKDLQNLVQLGVLQPPRRRGLFVFDCHLLCVARVAFYLRQTLGTTSELLTGYTSALADQMGELWKSRPEYVLILNRLEGERDWVEVKVPFRRIVERLEERIQQAPLFADLPRGRKRAGWKKEFFDALQEAAKDLGNSSRGGVKRAIGAYRRAKRPRPEVKVVAA